MQELALSVAIFNYPLRIYNIHHWRGIVLEKVKAHSSMWSNAAISTDYLHNHEQDNGSHIIRRYPLIQYKELNHQAGIISLGNAHDVSDILIELWQNDNAINGRKGLTACPITRYKKGQAKIGFSNNRLRYSIENWAPLNKRNHQKWNKLEGLSAKIKLLENILIGNILGFAEGIGWQIEQQITLEITDLNKQNTLQFKSRQMLAFNLQFSTNVMLPPLIGLGQNVSFGCGTVSRR